MSAIINVSNCPLELIKVQEMEGCHNFPVDNTYPIRYSSTYRRADHRQDGHSQRKVVFLDPPPLLYPPARRIMRWANRDTWRNYDGERELYPHHKNVYMKTGHEPLAHRRSSHFHPMNHSNSSCPDRHYVEKSSAVQSDQDATNLLLTAASALTSLTRQQPSPDNCDSQRTENKKIDEDSTTLDILKKKNGREKAIRFPIKLMNILSCEEYFDIIAWMPDGKAFIIKKPKALVTNVLPHHFKEVKFSSFTRKLHRWGFTKMLRGKDCGAYTHKDFQRGNLELCEKMRCCEKVDPDPHEDSSITLTPVSSQVSDMNYVAPKYRMKEKVKEYPCQQVRESREEPSTPKMCESAFTPPSMESVRSHSYRHYDDVRYPMPTLHTPTSLGYSRHGWMGVKSNVSPDRERMMRQSWNGIPHRESTSNNSDPNTLRSMEYTTTGLYRL